MIAYVIPSRRTPRGIEGFDYAIPEGMDVRTGDLVRIPFQKGQTVGLIAEIREKSEINTPLKPLIGAFEDLHLPEQAVQLLIQLSERSFTSLPSVLHAWLGVLPKRKSKGRGPSAMQAELAKALRAGARGEELKKNTTQPILLPNPLNHPNGIIAKIKQALEQNKRVFILSPWSSRAERIARECGVQALTNELAAGKRFALWSSFLLNESSLLVSTRIGAWCAVAADIIIVDEPENDDHKQDELAPRYDARWIAAYLHSKGIELELIGTTPRLSNIAHQEVPSAEPIPDIFCRCIYTDTHYADWSDIPGIQGRSLLAMEEAIRNGQPCFIIHPISGEQSRLRCKDCGWSAVCEVCGAGMLVEKGTLFCRRCHHRTPMIMQCPGCGGTEFAHSKPGRIKLAETIKKKSFPNTAVLSIGEWNALPAIPKNSFVLLTDLSLLAGAREDLRRKEQLIIAWRRLADTCGAAEATLAVQSDPKTIAEAKEWLEAKGCYEAFIGELREREAFHLPPTVRLIKLIFRGSEPFAERMLHRLKSSAQAIPEAEVSGPFEVRFRPSHRETRWIGHLSTPLATPLQELIRVLAPIASQTNTLIDLDPIAFFE